MIESMKNDIVLFDLDGTVTASAPGICRCVQYALEKLGRPPLTEEKLRLFIGPPLLKSFQKHAGLSEEDSHSALALYRERFSDVGWRENSVYPGLPNLLRALRARGTFVALATGKPQVFADRIIDYFGLSGMFDRVVGSSLHEIADKATIITRAMEGRSGRAVMIGDRAEDIRGAAENGIDSIGALYGYGEAGELDGATHTARDIPALSELLLGGVPGVRGYFITFEGLDGCGKTSQMRSAGRWLEDSGYEVVLLREPGGTETSERIRAIVLDAELKGMTDKCEAMLFAAARAQLVEALIEPALRRGAVVLCDRFVDSSIAYQGYGRMLGAELVAQINSPAIGALRPDCTLFFDIGPEIAAERKKNMDAPDRMELEALEFNQRVYQGYRALADQHPQRIRRVDASVPIEEVEEQVAARLRACIGR